MGRTRVVMWILGCLTSPDPPSTRPSCIKPARNAEAICESRGFLCIILREDLGKMAAVIPSPYY